MKKAVLRATHLCKQFTDPVETTVLQDISLEVFSGQTVAIVGKSGEGKTTLLHLLGVLEEPTSGRVEICGIEATRKNYASLRNRHIGFVFQVYNLLEDYSVLDNVLMPARIAGKATHPGSKAYRSALSLIDEVSLTPRTLFPAKLLSGGEKQRVAIARAFINDPALILADEPSGSLDHYHAHAVDTLLLKEAKKRGKAVVIVTHDLSVASQCDTKYSLKKGVISKDA